MTQFVFDTIVAMIVGILIIFVIIALVEIGVAIILNYFQHGDDNDGMSDYDEE